MPKIFCFESPEHLADSSREPLSFIAKEPAQLFQVRAPKLRSIAEVEADLAEQGSPSELDDGPLTRRGPDGRLVPTLGLPIVLDDEEYRRLNTDQASLDIEMAERQGRARPAHRSMGRLNVLLWEQSSLLEPDLDGPLYEAIPLPEGFSRVHGERAFRVDIDEKFVSGTIRPFSNDGGHNPREMDIVLAGTNEAIGVVKTNPHNPRGMVRVLAVAGAGDQIFSRVDAVGCWWPDPRGRSLAEVRVAPPDSLFPTLLLDAAFRQSWLETSRLTQRALPVSKYRLTSNMLDLERARFCAAHSPNHRREALKNLDLFGFDGGMELETVKNQIKSLKMERPKRNPRPPLLESDGERTGNSSPVRLTKFARDQLDLLDQINSKFEDE